MLIRVLHVVHSMDAGGIETLLMEIYRKLDRSKIQFDFLVNTEKTCIYDDEIRRLGGKIYVIKAPQQPIYLGAHKRELRAFFEGHPEYKIVHCHGNAMSVYALAAAKRADIPVRIAHSHVAGVKFSYKSMVYSWNKLFINRLATDRFACSKIAAEWLFGKEKGKDAVIVKNGIDSAKFAYNTKVRKFIRTKENCNSKFVIGHVGRFTEPKNQSFIVEIFNEVAKNIPDSELWLIGKGPLMPKIKEKVKSLNLESKVKFFGQISNVNQYMQGMDTFVFPSLYEGLGIVAVEAQCAGLKTFCSKAIPAEAKLTELLFYLDENRSAQDWASCIIKENANYERQDHSEQIVASGYDISTTVHGLEKFYIEKYSLQKP